MNALTWCIICQSYQPQFHECYRLISFPAISIQDAIIIKGECIEGECEDVTNKRSLPKLESE
jgi:hypothetical protein